MSKFACSCGEVMVSVTDDVPHAHMLFRFSDLHPIFETSSQEVLKYQARLRADEVELSFDESLHDLLTSKVVESGRDALLCANCGRLWLESSDRARKGQFDSFVPESSLENSSGPREPSH